MTKLLVMLFLMPSILFISPESASAGLSDSIGADLPGIQRVAIANYNNPWYSWGVDSGFVMPDYADETTSTYDAPYDTTTPKPSRPTPKPTMIVDPPRTRPPEDSTAYNLTDAGYYQTPDGWQYTLNADGYATIVGYTDISATSIALPDSIDGHTVIAIGSFAFTSEDGLSPFQDFVSVVIPDTVREIGRGAFCGCVLSEIRLSSNIVSIEPLVFAQCINLKKITIPPGVRTIGNKAFCNCDSLTELNIPDGVVMIGNEAFGACDQLKTVTIPDSMQVIDTNAFQHCGNLQTILFPAGEICISSNVFLKSDNVTMHVFQNSAAHQYAVANGIPFQLIENQAAPDEENKTTIFYMKPKGKGISFTRSGGFAAYHDTDMGFDDNNLSSVWIGSEYVTVILYELTEYGGQCLVLQGAGLHDLGDYDFDNLCSSYEITE